MMVLGKAVLFTALLCLGACSSSRPIPILNPEIPARSADRLIEGVLANEAKVIRYYSAKANVELRMPDGTKSFKAQVRSVEDSAVWVSVVPALGIEMARVLLTPDSLKLMDKLHGTYFVGDTADAKRKFGLQPGLGLLQQALLGRAINLEPQEKYRSDRDGGQYVLTSKEKRRFIRAAEDISPGDTLVRDKDMGERRLERTLRKAEEREAVVFRYWLEPKDLQVTRVQIADLVRDQTADVLYEKRGEDVAGGLPTRITITLSEPGRTATGILDLSRIQLEGPWQMNFKVPEKFGPMP